MSSSTIGSPAWRQEVSRLLIELGQLRARAGKQGSAAGKQGSAAGKQGSAAEETQREIAALVETLTELHLPLVRHLAGRFNGRSVPYDDLVQVGSIGLLKAIERFDPERGVEFASYATPTILGEIKRHFRDAGWLIHVPRRAQELQGTLTLARAELSQELRRSPTVAELAERAGVGEEQVLEAIDVARSYAGVPLDSLGEADGSGPGAMRFAATDAGLDRVELREILRPALETLSERDRLVLSLRFAEAKTQTEIAEIVGISQMQVSRVLSTCLAQLRERLAGTGLETSA